MKTNRFYSRMSNELPLARTTRERLARRVTDKPAFWSAKGTGRMIVAYAVVVIGAFVAGFAII